tara:strand:+ start:805 stop:1476 length:672 start_codon:yes stop_codon:yes gene_type:complete
MKNQNLRYEKKWISNNLSYENIYCKLLRLNFFFNEQYQKRIVNSVYYDDSSCTGILDNVEGELRRKKYRLRWYGNSKKEKQFYFEVKYKNGFISSKKRQKIILNHKIDVTNPENFQKIREKFNINLKNKNLLKPKIFINYKRTYLTSSNRLIRSTIDQNISYKKFSTPNSSPFKKLRSFIIEFKYGISLDSYFRSNLTNFPFRYSKSSKYVMCMLYNKNLYFN